MNSTPNSIEPLDEPTLPDTSTQSIFMLPIEVGDGEYLYRGVVRSHWDFVNNRITSATFKDSGGVSVDRDGGRSEQACIEKILAVKDFKAVCKIQAANVRRNDALILYKPIEANIFHSEIHDSSERIQMRGKKPSNLNNEASLVYERPEE